MTGMGSHQSAASGTDVWLTPPAIIEALGGVDSFDLDPCAAVGQPWATARRHLTEIDNSLRMPWVGRCWVNPPYTTALAAKFMARMAEHDHGTAMIFARTETDTFHRFVWETASGILFLRGRVHFHYPDGTRADANAGAPSVLIAYGSEDRDILAAAPIDGYFMPLRLPVSMLVQALNPTWREALETWFAGRNEPVSLAELYKAFATHPKARANQNWQAKIRQVLERAKFERVDKGLWTKRERAGTVA